MNRMIPTNQRKPAIGRVMIVNLIDVEVVFFEAAMVLPQ
jgi:hypothetical protein